MKIQKNAKIQDKANSFLGMFGVLTLNTNQWRFAHYFTTSKSLLVLLLFFSPWNCQLIVSLCLTPTIFSFFSDTHKHTNTHILYIVLHIWSEKTSHVGSVGFLKAYERPVAPHWLLKCSLPFPFLWLVTGSYCTPVAIPTQTIQSVCVFVCVMGEGFCFLFFSSSYVLECKWVWAATKVCRVLCCVHVRVC